MPLPPLHSLPLNPTTGQQPHPSLTTRNSGHPPPAGTSTGGVSRETLKALHDVYWSDDEDDPDCLLCAEPLDLSDLNFKPCQCGLQICQFCYNKLLSSDARCPGCRRTYDTKAVVFQPVDWEEVKKAKEKKAKKAKTIKQLTGTGRRHLLGVRIVMKNTAYVIGMKIPSPGDEALSILRSNDYFGQYGKISKLYLADSKAVSTAVPSIGDDSFAPGIYIVFVRREDAARCISSLDGIPAPQGPPGATLKATYGTTRYCEAFLKGMKCDNSGCHSLHEWGGESDCFTKEDLETAFTRPTEYDARQKQASQSTPSQSVPSLMSKVAWPKPSGDDSQSLSSAATGLPSAASWGKGIGAKIPSRVGPPGPGAISRPTKISNVLPIKNNAAFPLPTPSPTIPIIIKEKKEKKSSAMARARSTDSSAPGSAQTSPKRKVPALTSSKPTAVSIPAPTSSKSPPAPVPVSAVPPARESSPVFAPESPEGYADEHMSGDSDAEPSSDSPAPQTPSRMADSIPPQPLSDEPFIIHSPYPEPIIFTFPAHDKDFAFVLGLDDEELQRVQAQAEGYEPSPFSKTLEGLAELGVHAPEVPELFTPLSPRLDHYSGFFRPFEADENSPALSDNTPGPSEQLTDDHNAQRTESRFGFARATGGSTRTQSPFRRGMSDANMRDGWYRNEQQQQQQQPEANSHISSLAAQLAGFGGSYDSASGASVSGVTDSAWTNDSAYAPSPALQQRGQQQTQQQQYDVRSNGRFEQPLLPGQFMQKGMRDREEFDNSLLAMLQYGNSNQQQHQPIYTHQNQQSQQRAMFSPESASHSMHEEQGGPFSPLAYTQMQQAQQPQIHPDARQLMHMHQRRGQSPAPLGAHGYRRF